jgi:hypothetical protein
MRGYVVDHLALTAGLTDTGSEHHRREMSRLLHSAIDGGPPLIIPAVCLAATAGVRPVIATHMTVLLADAPSGAIEFSALIRTPVLDALRITFPAIDCPTTHAALQAMDSNAPILTTTPLVYVGIPVDVLSL